MLGFILYYLIYCSVYCAIICFVTHFCLFNRIYLFRKNGEIVWDRRSRIDKIYGSGDQSDVAKEKNTKKSKRKQKRKSKPSSSEESNQENDPNEEQMPAQFQWPEDFQVQRIPCFRYASASEQWVPESEPPAPASSSSQSQPPELAADHLKIVTFNVLNDMLDLERFDRVLKVLGETDADVILLQEVTHEFLQALLTHEFLLNSGYCINQTLWWGVNDNGLRILSKLPIVQTAISKSQRQLGAVIKVDAPKTTWFARILNVHLTSRYHEVDEYTEKQGISKRTNQLEYAIAAINFQHSRDTLPVIAGDFNFADGTEEDEILRELQSQYSIIDAWKETHTQQSSEAETETGFTYNPATNELTAMKARHKEPRRLDRILISNLSKQFKLLEMSLIANMCEHSPPSDHYGLA